MRNGPAAFSSVSILGVYPGLLLLDGAPSGHSLTEHSVHDARKRRDFRLFFAEKLSAPCRAYPCGHVKPQMLKGCSISPVLQTKGKIPLLALLCLLLESFVACGVSSVPSTLRCDPNNAPEVQSVTVENTGQENLQNYPVAVALDKTNFDFSVASKDGSDLTVWDATTHEAIPDWLESYDPALGKGLLWVKLAALGSRASQRLLLTAGQVTGCTAPGFTGYSVFPFFGDANDVLSWHPTNRLSITNTVVGGPLTINSRSVIESDAMYNGFPAVVQAANGDFVLSYKKGPSHVNSPLVMLRRSQDGGATWSPEVVYFDSSKPDPALTRTPLGALLIAFVKLDQNGGEAGAYSRSADNGLTWGPFTFFDNPPTNTFVMDPLVNAGQTLYGAGYGPYRGGAGYTPTVWSSSDDGLTWTKLSELREPGDPGLNETAIAQTAPNTLFAMMRTDDGLDTFGRYSNDMGMTWGPLVSYTSQVGVLQAPMMIQTGSALILMGRESTAIPGVQPAALGYPRQLVAFVSYDAGQTFGAGIVLDTYTGEAIDGGYSWPILLANGQVFVVYYADSHNLREPDIKALTLSVTQPSTQLTNSIHVLSQLAPGLATRALSLNVTRYSLEFRFSSKPTPAGSQFSVVLQGQASGSASSLINWELPSTHAADPTADSGVISNGQFVPVLNSFIYGQPYRLRTVVDETQGTQQVSVLDKFGAWISATTPLPLARPTSHATTIQIGNNSNLRATDTLLDFVFVRPAAQTEPQVIVTRVH
jgi:hypothetical protein